jgi:hypothetical protein
MDGALFRFSAEKMRQIAESQFVGLLGSVATLELRRNLAIASAKLDRHRAEQTKNEAME